MIAVKEAVQKALEFVSDIYANEKLTDARVEEIELKEGSVWHITVSYLRGLSPSELAEAIGGKPVREYKVVEVDAQDGLVRSMKIRQLA